MRRLDWFGACLIGFWCLKAFWDFRSAFSSASPKVNSCIHTQAIQNVSGQGENANPQSQVSSLCQERSERSSRTRSKSRGCDTEVADTMESSYSIEPVPTGIPLSADPLQCSFRGFQLSTK